MHDATQPSQSSGLTAAIERFSGNGLSARSLRVVKPLPQTGGFDRWLTLDDDRQTNHVLYDLTPLVTRYGRDALSESLERRTAIRHPHVLPVDTWWWDAAAGMMWMCSPYIGNSSGIYTVDAVRMSKGGVLPPAEACRAAEQILSALTAFHAQGFVRGSVDPMTVLVDRSGSICIEHHALDQVMRPSTERGMSEAIRDELCEVAAIVESLLTGRGSMDPPRPVSRLLRRDGVAWERWIERATDPIEGFASMTDAIAALPGVGRALIEAAPLVETRRTVVENLRAVMRSVVSRS